MKSIESGAGRFTDFLLPPLNFAEFLRFTGIEEELTDYELGGTAYLVTVSGFDQWELFLSLHPAGESWAVWRADHPTRLLRQPRGN